MDLAVGQAVSFCLSFTWAGRVSFPIRTYLDEMWAKMRASQDEDRGELARQSAPPKKGTSKKAVTRQGRLAFGSEGPRSGTGTRAVISTDIMGHDI